MNCMFLQVLTAALLVLSLVVNYMLWIDYKALDDKWAEIEREAAANNGIAVVVIE